MLGTSLARTVIRGILLVRPTVPALICLIVAQNRSDSLRRIVEITSTEEPEEYQKENPDNPEVYKDEQVILRKTLEARPQGGIDDVEVAVESLATEHNEHDEHGFAANACDIERARHARSTSTRLLLSNLASSHEIINALLVSHQSVRMMCKPHIHELR